MKIINQYTISFKWNINLKFNQMKMENNESRVNVSGQALKVAQKAMTIAETRFNIGDLSLIDLLEAENNLAQAELDLLRLKYEYILAQLDYKKVCGYYPEIDSTDWLPHIWLSGAVTRQHDKTARNADLKDEQIS